MSDASAGPPPAPDRDYFAFCRMLSRYAAWKYGSRAVGFTIHLADGSRHVEPIPVPPYHEGRGPQPWPGPPPRAPSPEQGGNCPRRILSDCQQVYWPGLGTLTFTGKKALAVARLWDAWESGSPEVPQRELLEAAGSDSNRVRDLFKDHPAMGTMIVPGRPGHWKLADVPAEEPEVVPGEDEPLE